MEEIPFSIPYKLGVELYIYLLTLSFSKVSREEDSLAA